MSAINSISHFDYMLIDTIVWSDFPLLKVADEFKEALFRKDIFSCSWILWFFFHLNRILCFKILLRKVNFE